MQVYEKVKKGEEMKNDIEAEMKDLFDIIDHCIQLLNKKDGVELVFNELHPRNWKIKEVNLLNPLATIGDE